MNHRRYNKWYKEIWWWLIERFTEPKFYLEPCTKEAKKWMKKVHKKKGKPNE